MRTSESLGTGESQISSLSYFVQVIRLCISHFESRVTHLKSELRDLPFTPEEGSQGKGQGKKQKGV